VEGEPTKKDDESEGNAKVDGVAPAFQENEGGHRSFKQWIK